MKTKFTLIKWAALLLLLSTLNHQLSTVHAQGTEFTYQGRLNSGANPANGSYDLRFTLYDSTNNPGTLIAGPLTNSATVVSNGLFTVTLDFGASAFPGANRWLEVGARTNGGGSFTTLSPRQPVLSTPYATRAANFDGPVSDNQLSANMARLNGTNQLFTGVVQLTNSANLVNGALRGNGANVTNVNLATINSAGTISLHSNIFLLSSSPGVGDGPTRVVSADINGDGRADLISADSLTNKLSILTNDGSGRFSPAASPTVGSDPGALAAADVNGDGHIDLISGSSSSALLTVLTNNGSGGFTTASSPSAGAGVDDMAAADVNHDGRMDLVTISEFPDQVSVLTNTAGGWFTVAQTRFVTDVAYSVIAADLNGDGWVDIVGANYLSNSVSVLTNNGNGTFATSVAFFGVAGSPYSVAATDVNGDGSPDLISGSSDGTISVLTNNGSASFILASSVFTPLGSVNSIMAADIIGDSRAEIIGAHINAQKLSVLTNNGGGVFAVAYVPPTGFGPISVAAADVNTDNRLDLISANYHVDTLSVLVQVAPATFAGEFRGDGSALENLSASALSFGTLSDARLSANVALLDQAQTFTAAKTFGSGSQLFADSGSASAPGYAFNGDANLGVFRPAADNLALTTAGAERMRIDAAGAVGIGTTVPEAPLHVAEGSAGSVTANANSIAVFEKSGAGYVSLLGPDANELALLFGSPNNAQDGGIVFNNSGTARGLQFRTGTNTTRMVIQNSGNVGIGTTNPTRALEIQHAGDTEIGIKSTDAGGHLWTLQSSSVSGSANLDASFQIFDRTLSAPRFYIGTNGFVGLGTTSPTNKLHVAGGVSATIFVTTSDRNAKENFEPVSTADVLEKVAGLPITRWTFKEMPGQKHLGPMAQDFEAAFGLGAGDTGIATVDADGVALAAIQGLNQKVEVGSQTTEIRSQRSEERIQKLEAENAELKQRLEALEKMVLNQKPN